MQKLKIFCQENVIQGGLLRKACRIERVTNGKTISAESLWFEHPRLEKSISSHDAEPFLLMVLLQAMAEGRDLDIEGAVSRRLLSNLTEFQEYWMCGKPELFQRIEISLTDLLETAGTIQGEQAVLAFSGGVDSTFSLWRHAFAKAGFRTQKIRYCAFVHGFDIPLMEDAVFQSAYKRGFETTYSLGIPLIPVRTNCREVIGLNWEFWFGPALAAVLQLFKHECGLGLIPSGINYSDLKFPWGSNPAIDPLLSSAGFEIIHDGASYRRIKKIALLKQWDLGCSNLRVCWEGTQKDRNCGKCEKCLRNELAFYVNRLPRPPSFPLELRLAEILKVRVHNHFVMAEWYDLARTGWHNKINFSILAAIAYVVLVSRFQNALKWRLKTINRFFKKN